MNMNMMIARAATRLPVRDVRHARRVRNAHFMSWPPSMPARPHPKAAGVESAGTLRYGWGDWFIASVVSSFAAWPVVFATDLIWCELLFPNVGTPGYEGAPRLKFDMLSTASLIPKAAGSYLGAHLYVPHAWWVWKLTLLPALPLSFAISMAIYIASTPPPGSTNGDVSGESAAATSEPSLQIVSTAWLPSTPEPASIATRLRHAAPTSVQVAVRTLGL